MTEQELIRLIASAIFGGGIAILWQSTQKWYIDPGITASNVASRKLVEYSKTLWLACDDLEVRLTQIANKYKDRTLEPLYWQPSDSTPVRWHVEDGYYATSTAYLLANLLAWIRLFERDVSCLKFTKKSDATKLLHEFHSLKRCLSKKDVSILWYQYLNGIGDFLIDAKRPMSIAAFSIKLSSDDHFRSFYGQLFRFLNSLRDDTRIELINDAISVIRTIKPLLERRGAVPEVIYWKQWTTWNLYSAT